MHPRNNPTRNTAVSLSINNDIKINIFWSILVNYYLLFAFNIAHIDDSFDVTFTYKNTGN